MAMESVASQIDSLEAKVNDLAISPKSDSLEMRCQRVEGLMSTYVSLLEKIDREVETIPEQTRWSDVELDRWVPWYQHQASLGAKIRDQIRPLKSAVSEVRGLHEFMTSFVAARAWADASSACAFASSS